jgi:hypothetical protein
MITLNCKSAGCKTQPVWRVVGTNDFTVCYLCEEHKVSWYDASEKEHATTLEKLPAKEEQHEVVTDDTGNRGVAKPQYSQSVSQGAKNTDRGSYAAGMDSGREDRNLAVRPGHKLHFSDSDEGAGGDTILPYRPETRAQSYGNLGLTKEEQSMLSSPPGPDVVEIRPDGVVYAPWSGVAERMDDALGIGEWTLVPEGKPMLQDGFVCWQFHLFVRGHWVTTSIGEHPDPKRRKLSLANRAEAAKSDALTKCSKALGVFREMWIRGWTKEWQAENCERVWALQDEYTPSGAWLWRRKDKRPFWKEGKPGRQSESEYKRPQSMEDDARDHLDSIQKEGQ